MNGPCWALVPVKTRDLCKSRLAGRLAAGPRLSLVRSMLERALAALIRRPAPVLREARP